MSLIIWGVALWFVVPRVWRLCCRLIRGRERRWGDIPRGVWVRSGLAVAAIAAFEFAYPSFPGESELKLPDARPFPEQPLSWDEAATAPTWGDIARAAPLLARFAAVDEQRIDALAADLVATRIEWNEYGAALREAREAEKRAEEGEPAPPRPPVPRVFRLGGTFPTASERHALEQRATRDGLPSVSSTVPAREALTVFSSERSLADDLLTGPLRKRADALLKRFDAALRHRSYGRDGAGWTMDCKFGVDAANGAAGPIPWCDATIRRNSHYDLIGPDCETAVERSILRDGKGGALGCIERWRMPTFRMRIRPETTTIWRPLTEEERHALLDGSALADEPPISRWTLRAADGSRTVPLSPQATVRTDGADGFLVAGSGFSLRHVAAEGPEWLRWTADTGIERGFQPLDALFGADPPEGVEPFDGTSMDARMLVDEALAQARLFFAIVGTSDPDGTVASLGPLLAGSALGRMTDGLRERSRTLRAIIDLEDGAECPSVMARGLYINPTLLRAFGTKLTFAQRSLLRADGRDLEGWLKGSDGVALDCERVAYAMTLLSGVMDGIVALDTKIRRELPDRGTEATAASGPAPEGA